MANHEEIDKAIVIVISPYQSPCYDGVAGNCTCRNLRERPVPVIAEEDVLTADAKISDVGNEQVHKAVIVIVRPLAPPEVTG